MHQEVLYLLNIQKSLKRSPEKSKNTLINGGLEMTFQTFENNEINRDQTSKTDLKNEIRSTWLA